MRIFVTGGTGQLGRALAQVCQADDLYLGVHGADDITRQAIVQRVLQFRPDVVIHAAAMTDVDACELAPDQAFLVNAQGTRNVAEGARQSRALMVYVSSDYVFDGAKNTPYLETDLTNPINEYGRSKLAGEGITCTEAECWLVLRTSWLFGAGRPNFVTNVLEWARSQPIIRLVKDKVGSPTYALDLARAIRHVIEAGLSNQLLHVSGSGECNWVEYGQEILARAGLEKRIEPISFDELRRPARRPAYSVLDKATLKRSGFEMPHWRAALAEFLRVDL